MGDFIIILALIIFILWLFTVNIVLGMIAGLLFIGSALK